MVRQVARIFTQFLEFGNIPADSLDLTAIEFAPLPPKKTSKTPRFSRLLLWSPVSWVDYLGAEDVLTNTDLDRFVSSVW